MDEGVSSVSNVFQVVDESGQTEDSSGGLESLGALAALFSRGRELHCIALHAVYQVVVLVLLLVLHWYWYWYWPWVQAHWPPYAQEVESTALHCTKFTRYLSLVDLCWYWYWY